METTSSIDRKNRRAILAPPISCESIAPYRLLQHIEAIIPWSSKSGLLDAAKAQQLGHTQLADWLKKAEGLWDKHGRKRLTLSEQLDYFGKLVAQFPAPKIRVLYAASGTLPAAAILLEQRAVVEHKLYWAAVESLDEAKYLLAC